MKKFNQRQGQFWTDERIAFEQHVRSCRQCVHWHAYYKAGLASKRRKPEDPPGWCGEGRRLVREACLSDEGKGATRDLIIWSASLYSEVRGCLSSL